jgi:hypothetical protein
MASKLKGRDGVADTRTGKGDSAATRLTVSAPEFSPDVFQTSSTTTTKSDISSSSSSSPSTTAKSASLSSSSASFTTGTPVWCRCQASLHALFCNCLSCGAIICELAAGTSCAFCGKALSGAATTPTSAASSAFGAAGITAASVKEARERASELGGAVEPAIRAAAARHKDKLLEYDRTSSSRTRVYDDQADYFSNSTSAWLSEGEREAAAKAAEERVKALTTRPEGMKLTLDFAGRTVKIVDEREVQEAAERASLLALVRARGIDSHVAPAGELMATSSSSNSSSSTASATATTFNAQAAAASPSSSSSSSTSSEGGGEGGFAGASAFRRSEELHGRISEVYDFLMQSVGVREKSAPPTASPAVAFPDSSVLQHSDPIAQLTSTTKH